MKIKYACCNAGCANYGEITKENAVYLPNFCSQCGKQLFDNVEITLEE